MILPFAKQHADLGITATFFNTLRKKRFANYKTHIGNSEYVTSFMEPRLQLWKVVSSQRRSNGQQVSEDK